METTNNNEEDVKDIDTSYVEPSTDEDDELVTIDENETQPLSSDGENEEEETVESEPEPEPIEDEGVSEEEPVVPSVVEGKKLEGETLREYALRMELENTRKLLREQKKEDLFVKIDKSSPQKDDILSQYDAEEVERLEQIVSRLGYVKSSDLQTQTFESTANDQLVAFMDTHPEYLAENDKDGVLWNTFRNEFNLYKKPENPKDYKKIFERIHSNLKNSTAIDIKKVNASKEKLKVASHSGAAIVGRNAPKQSQNTTGIRDDMLKGFTDEEKAELLS